VCRLFALHAGPHDVPAEFWLLHAPDSFAAQSEHNADGFGIATLSTRDGQLLVRNPIKAADDQTYRQVSQRARASQFLAHLRYASTGVVSLANTHPFLMDNRAFAHNGVVGDLPEVERRLGTSLAMVGGTTDTERFFALLTIRIREAGNDVRAGIVAAVHELARDIELYSLNFVLSEPGHLWAFRYPEHNPLWLLHREPHGDPLVQNDAAGTLHLHPESEIEHPIVVVASERTDDDPDWEEVGVGELVHIGPDLALTREVIITEGPARPMDLTGHAARTQAYERD
jgi:predicted glutamine amidotransferase